MRCGSALEGSGLLGPWASPSVFRSPCPASLSLLGMTAARRGHMHVFPDVCSFLLGFLLSLLSLSVFSLRHSVKPLCNEWE